MEEVKERGKEESALQMKRLTPVLVVDRIEPVLPFWVERLGFEKAVEVPGEQGLGFVALTRDGVEVMYQTRLSLQAELPELARVEAGCTLFVEVQELDAVEDALAGVAQVTPRRRTFYGSEEIVVRDPTGNVVVFAEFGSD